MSPEGRIFASFIEHPILLIPLAAVVLLWLIFKNLFASVPGAIRDLKKGGNKSASKTKESASKTKEKD